MILEAMSRRMSFTDKNSLSENSVWTIDPDTPKWLTKDYMKQCLQSYYKDPKLILNRWHTEPAIDKGSNFCGSLLRIKVEFLLSNHPNKLRKSYVAKMPYQNDKIFERIIGPYDVFNCEMNMYEHVKPKIKALLEEINDDDEIFAETLTMDRDKSLLILEDLNERDFFVPDRLEGLNIDMLKILLRKLAKFHATTAVLNERNQGSMEKFNRGMFNRQRTDNPRILLKCFDAFIYRISQIPELSYLTEKLTKLKQVHYDILLRIFDPISENFNVLNHGDLWTANMFVKYADKSQLKALDMIIIDYQFSVWGSPAIDLWYTLSSSLSEDLNNGRMEEFIQYYYQTLRATLEKLNFQAAIPSLHQFHIQMQLNGFYRFHTTAMILPLQRNIHPEDANFQVLVDTNERGERAKYTMYTNPYCHRIFKRLCPLYDSLGLLESDQ